MQKGSCPLPGTLRVNQDVDIIQINKCEYPCDGKGNSIGLVGGVKTLGVVVSPNNKIFTDKIYSAKQITKKKPMMMLDNRNM